MAIPTGLFPQTVDGSKSSIPITIKIFDDDDDDPGSAGDDHADAEDGPGNNVDITLDLKTCSFSGELNGNCGLTAMTIGDDDGDALLRSQVNFVGFDDTAIR